MTSTVPRHGSRNTQGGQPDIFLGGLSYSVKNLRSPWYELKHIDNYTLVNKAESDVKEGDAKLKDSKVYVRVVLA